MPKQKTKRAAAKRFKFTGTGKIKRAAAYHRHCMTHKSQSTRQGIARVRSCRRVTPSSSA